MLRTLGRGDGLRVSCLFRLMLRISYLEFLLKNGIYLTDPD